MHFGSGFGGVVAGSVGFSSGVSDSAPLLYRGPGVCPTRCPTLPPLVVGATGEEASVVGLLVGVPACVSVFGVGAGVPVFGVDAGVPVFGVGMGVPVT